jgi:peptidoglycan/LPS O-acetylase OafA/YrhL
VCLLATLVFLPHLLDHFAVLGRFLGWQQIFDYLDYSTPNMLLHLSFLFGLMPAHASSTILPDWSLGLEMQFYAVFPLLAWAMQRFGAIRICAVMLPICLLALVVWGPLFREPSMLLLKIPVFCAGMLLSHAANPQAVQRRCVLTGAAITLPMTQYWYFGVDALWVATSVALIALLTQSLGEDSALSPIKFAFQRLLDNRLMRAGADVSYSVYLLQGSVLAMIGGSLFRLPEFVGLNPHVRTAMLFVAVFVTTTAVSFLVHRIIERPGIDCGHWLASRIEGSKAHQDPSASRARA